MVAISLALAAPVICDADTATRWLEDARIPLERVPVTQANLLPGLARASGEGPAQKAIDTLCQRGGDSLSLADAERWETASWSAYSFTLTATETTECDLVQESLVFTVGSRADADPTYALRSEPVRSTTPFAPCGAVARYRKEDVIDGDGTPVRLILQRTLEDEAVVATQVVVRRATPEGWHEQVLLDPAPPRLLDASAAGPLLSLAGDDANPWIVSHADRQIEGGTCTALPGQTVWRWENGAWFSVAGREALGRLADLGAWRLAGDDGWFLILAQDIENDRDLLKARMRRVQKRIDERVDIHESASFPGMNSGFLVVTPDPWPSEAEALEAKRRYGRRTGVYVKRGWAALDGCQPRGPIPHLAD